MAIKVDPKEVTAALVGTQLEINQLADRGLTIEVSTLETNGGFYEALMGFMREHMDKLQSNIYGMPSGEDNDGPNVAMIEIELKHVSALIKYLGERMG